MSRSRKIVLAGLLFGLVAAGLGWFPASSPAVAAQATPYNTYAAGPYSVRGNMILDAQGQPYAFHGVARDGLEFSCKGDPYLTEQYLALLGPRVAGVKGTFWYGNTVRLPLSEAFWLHGQPQLHCTAASYQLLVRTTIGLLILLKLNVIVDLQWTDAGGQSTGGAWQMPDADSVIFWQQMAKLYAVYPNVLFELYNEPHPYASTGDPWSCWRSGCPVVNDSSNDFYCGCKLSLSYQAVGMQTLVDTIRQAGARNLLLIGGLNWGFDLSELPTYALNGSNLVYDTHPYPYNGKLTTSDWDASFGILSATYPIISTESGEYDCKAGFMQPLIAYFDAHRISWIAWAWYAGGSPCAFPQLVSDYAGTPEAALGTYIYHVLLTYAGISAKTIPPPSPPGSGPVNRLWYFPGELVGDSFEQTLVLDNASAQDCAVQIEYVLQPAQGKPEIKMVSLTLAELGRISEPVNRDVGIAVNAPHVLVAEIVRVDSGATPACSGIVAERAVHLTDADFTGGSALAGQTKASGRFFFADVPTSKDQSATSALAVFNPGIQQAAISVNYFTGGRLLTTQKVILSALADSQIAPPVGLPAHVGAILNSDQPVVAARSTLLKNVRAGNAGDTLSGFTEVPGSPQSASDWLFAEGYVGADFQENLVLTNPASSGSVKLTISLQFANGNVSIFHTSVAARSQLVWDVNAHVAQIVGATANLGTEVVSNGPLIVEREMFFRYNAGGGLITGVTDVPGLPRASVATSYTFADGYSAPGFDEWLSLQNVTGARELITITLVHARQFTIYQVYLPPHNRGTVWLDRLLQESNQSAVGYDLSLTVQSDGGAFVVERPLYWNMSGSQGGSDMMGYGGK